MQIGRIALICGFLVGGGAFAQTTPPGGGPGGGPEGARAARQLPRFRTW